MTEEKKLRGLKEHNANLNKLITESLIEALIILMKEKDYQKISITDICKTAGVSRMAFYNNYQTKDNLLKESIVQSTKSIIEDIGSPFRLTTNIDWYKSLFSKIRSFSSTLKLIFDAGFEFTYLSTINELILHDKNIDSVKKYSRLIWAGGIVNTLIQWIKNDMKESINDISLFCYNSLSIWVQ